MTRSPFWRFPLRINSSLKAATIFEKSVSKEVEEFWVAALNPQLVLIEKQLLFRGTVDQCPVYPRDLLRFICLKNATSFIVCHNHPSGDARPSGSDLRITKKIFRLSQLVEIPLQDHIILGNQGFYSFADHQIFQRWANQRSY